MAKLALDRPLVIFDLETTGVRVGHDRIVEIAALKIHEDGRPEEWESLVNPEMPIPEAAMQVHGITNEEASQAPTLIELGDEIMAFFYNCDYGGYNCAKFDVPFFQAECDRVGIPLNLEAGFVVDVMRIWTHFERRTLAKCYWYYCGAEIEDAHQAMADVTATWHILQNQVEEYQLPWSAKDISGKLKPAGALDDDGKLKDVNGVPTLTFGKHRGIALRDAPKSYVSWLLRESVMPSANHILEDILRPKKKARRK